MPTLGDKDPNIVIPIEGMTAMMATDYDTSGVGITHAHVQIMKMAWGDDSTAERVTANRPLPVQLQGGTGAIDVKVARSDGITYSSKNKYWNWRTDGYPPGMEGRTGGGGAVVGSGPLDSSQSGGMVEYLAVAGSTYGSELLVGAFGIPGATLIGVTGDVRVGAVTATDATLATSAIQMVGVTSGLYVGNQFSINNNPSHAGQTFAHYWPVAITGGRPLNYETDSVRIDNTTIGISGGRVLSSSTDAVKVYGSDGKGYVTTVLHSNAGTTLGFSGDYAKVWIGGADINATVSVSATVGVTNGAPAFSPLRVQGFTAGAGHDPVIIRGENSGAVEITSSSNLNTNVQNTVTIDDTNIVNRLENVDRPLINNLSNIKQNTAKLTDIESKMTSGTLKASVTTIPPKRLVSGTVNASFGNATQLGQNSQLLSGVNIKNHPDSNGSIVVGGIGLGQNINNGYVLEVGESVFIEISNINQIYIRASGPGGNDKIVYIGS